MFLIKNYLLPVRGQSEPSGLCLDIRVVLFLVVVGQQNENRANKLKGPETNYHCNKPKLKVMQHNNRLLLFLCSCYVILM